MKAGLSKPGAAYMTFKYFWKPSIEKKRGSAWCDLNTRASHLVNKHSAASPMVLPPRQAASGHKELVASLASHLWVNPQAARGVSLPEVPTLGVILSHL